MPCHPSPCRGLAMKPVVVGITGASGSVLARSAVDELLRRDLPTTVVCSNAARIVWQDEMEAPFNDTLAEWREHPYLRDKGFEGWVSIEDGVNGMDEMRESIEFLKRMRAQYFG